MHEQNNGIFILDHDQDADEIYELLKPCGTNQDLTPYDTGDRAEPTVWGLDGGDRDRYGRVDFDDDEGSTVATIYLERNSDGDYVVHIDTARRIQISIDPH